MLPPLPERMRPQNLSEYVGQRHLVGPGCILRTMLDSGALSSFILWGPPGVGKTTLARIIAHTLDREFYTLSAVSSGVKDVREVIDAAKGKSLFSPSGAPILFIDEIHRFNKAQQDALLGAVEAGTVILIGATTENPSFEVITPLLSRCQVFVLKSLEVDDLRQLLDRALREDVLLKERNIEVRETDALFRHSGGDARKLLNILEIVVDSQVGKADPVVIDNRIVTACLQENVAIYDKGGEMHYDIISAFIKSVRGSDPNAAVYWMARERVCDLSGVVAEEQCGHPGDRQGACGREGRPDGRRAAVSAECADQVDGGPGLRRRLQVRARLSRSFRRPGVPPPFPLRHGFLRPPAQWG